MLKVNKDKAVLPRALSQSSLMSTRGGSRVRGRPGLAAAAPGVQGIALKLHSRHTHLWGLAGCLELTSELCWPVSVGDGTSPGRGTWRGHMGSQSLPGPLLCDFCHLSS